MKKMPCVEHHCPKTGDSYDITFYELGGSCGDCDEPLPLNRDELVDAMYVFLTSELGEE